MLKNKKWFIRKDYHVSDVLMPKNINPVVSSIQYDYVITEEMYQWGYENARDGNGWIDVDAVLKQGGTVSEGDITAKESISLLLNFVAGQEVKLDFSGVVGAPWYSEETDNVLKIYSLYPYTYKGRSQVTYIYSTKDSYVGLYDSAFQNAPLWVGCFILRGSVDSWVLARNTPFKYEEQIPSSYSLPSSEFVYHESWMSNKLPITPADVEGLFPEVLIKWDNTYPISPNYAQIQAALGDGMCPVIYRDYGSHRRFWHLIHTATDTSDPSDPPCSFTFVDMVDNTRHTIGPHSYPDSSEDCQWDEMHTTSLFELVVTMTMSQDMSTWTVDYTGAELSPIISNRSRLVVLKVVENGQPTKYLYNVSEVGTNTFEWRTLNNTPAIEIYQIANFTATRTIISLSTT